MKNEVGDGLSGLPGPVLITGHTGFKGVWLTLLLEKLGIPVIGLSLEPDKDSLYRRAVRLGSVPEEFVDVRDFASVKNFISKYQPSIIIHMAAQPLVLESYKTPRETFEVNVMGTANVLSAAFLEPSVISVGIVTTDKVYQNDDSGKAFVETDALSGKDPYSASKTATEAVVKAWQQIAKISGGPRVISLRSGNVIGGGDWAENRLLPDLIRAFKDKNKIELRSPNSTRPWMHVLDPLKGYLLAIEQSVLGNEVEAFNFGPNSKSLSVARIAELSQSAWPYSVEISYPISASSKKLESSFLSLNSTLAEQTLGWTPVWSQEQAVITTVKWWSEVFNNGASPVDVCMNDIHTLLSNR
jgi:CDP-glucose 4,6-dehydratase